MPLQIFISYARVNHDKAYAVAGRLSTAGFKPFIDQWSIEAGSKWRTDIHNALDRCSALVLVCTQESVVSKEVLFELAYAMGLKKKIIPLLYQSADLPQFLAELNALDFREYERWEQLIAELRQLSILENTTADFQGEGLLRLGSGRSERARSDYIHEILDSAKRGTTITVVGRSLIDWAMLWSIIESRIYERHLNIKLGLIDETSFYERNGPSDERLRRSWIEPPIPGDWAITDVPESMKKFRQVRITAQTGSLRIYGLPFYPTHSFVAFTKEIDGKRYCLEEAGIASEKGRRPFLELCGPASGNSYSAILEAINESFLTEDRLLLFDDGDQRTSRSGPGRRGMIVADKVDLVGLVDIAIGHRTLDWPSATIADRIDKTPKNGEIFIVARSVVTWTTHWQHLAGAILNRGLRCTFILADRTVKSLVQGDFAEHDVPKCLDIFEQTLTPYLRERWSQCSGQFLVYTIPCYVPTTFASYMGHGGNRFCSLEVGIGVGPEVRPIMYFQNVSEDDAYTHLNQIHRQILTGRHPVIKVP